MEAASPPEPGVSLPPGLSRQVCVLQVRGPRERRRGRERGKSPPLRSALATLCNPALEVAREILQDALEAVEETTRRQEKDFTVSTIRPFLPYPAEKGVTSDRAFLVVSPTLPFCSQFSCRRSVGVYPFSPTLEISFHALESSTATGVPSPACIRPSSVNLSSLTPSVWNGSVVGSSHHSLASPLSGSQRSRSCSYISVSFQNPMRICGDTHTLQVKPHNSHWDLNPPARTRSQPEPKFGREPASWDSNLYKTKIGA